MCAAKANEMKKEMKDLQILAIEVGSKGWALIEEGSSNTFRFDYCSVSLGD